MFPATPAYVLASRRILIDPVHYSYFLAFLNVLADSIGTGRTAVYYETLGCLPWTYPGYLFVFVSPFIVVLD